MTDRSRLSPQLRSAVTQALGRTESQLIVPTVAGQPAAVLHDEIAIQRFVENDCGADGFTIEKGKLVALRWRDGAAFKLKTYDIDAYGTA